LPSEAPFPIRAGLLDRLPGTFLPVLNEQLGQWPQLFPAEQRPIRATLDYLGGLPAEVLQGLLQPVFDLERKMNLPGWDKRRDRLSISDTGVLARSPLYPDWRKAVEQVFAAINERLESAGPDGPGKHPKLVLCVLPAGLPLASQPLWPRLAGQGRWCQLERPLGGMLDGLMDWLAARPAPVGVEAIEHTWVLEAGTRFVSRDSPETLTVLSYQNLGRAREEFCRELNEVDKELRALDETYDHLRDLDVTPLLPPRVAAHPRLAGFVRQLFLSGNGAVNFCNSFVQWGSSEAMRRAQPQVTLCLFGIRDRLKPFSSLVLFEDQRKANPVADEPDPVGSLTDIQLLCEYVFLSAGRLPGYEGRTGFLLGAEDSDLLLAVAPAGWARIAGERPDAAELRRVLSSWLGLAPARA
jgi:hypothetical protein